jgi:hypothetical protein
MGLVFFPDFYFAKVLLFFKTNVPYASSLQDKTGGTLIFIRMMSK